MQLDVKRKGVSKKVMVLGQKGGFWDKCRSGWSDLAGALTQTGPPYKEEKQQLANLSSGKNMAQMREVSEE